MSQEDGAWLFALLYEMQERPQAWLGCGKVRCLENYLAGFMHARRALGLAALSDSESTRWNGFTEWCKREKLSTNVSDTRGWCESVEALDSSENNVATFFAFLDEFLQTRGETLRGLAEL